MERLDQQASVSSADALAAENRSRLDSDALGDDAIILSEDIQFLQKYGIARDFLIRCQKRAQTLGVAPADCLLASGFMSEIEYFRCVAFELRLDFVDQVDLGGPPFFDPPSPESLDQMARMVETDQHPTKRNNAIYLAPDCRQLPALKKLLNANPDLVRRLKIAPFGTLKKSLLSRCKETLLTRAINSLNDHYRLFSAKRVITIPQTISLIILLQMALIAALYSTGGVLLALHLVGSLFYIGCIWLRILATTNFVRPPVDVRQSSNIRMSDDSLPFYSILVPLYKEAGQVRDLIDSLLKMDWPREYLEIKLICEMDDVATQLEASRVLNQLKYNHISIINVPVSEPRTKPKALNFVLPMCKGEYLVVYDAEDRPHPAQLREAHLKFLNSGPEVVCLQAPLCILNHSENWLSGLFGIEYSCLFDGLLPYLASKKAPIPLGGTSNHFKKTVLETIGGWDPYNVTEDADLGMRLARAGCVVKMLSKPTFEEAPITLNIWLKQRTRWFKGWYQTWLVHMRSPFSLVGDFGIRNAVIFHLLITGMAVSALIHPFLLYFILIKLMGGYSAGVVLLKDPLFLLDIFTIILGYLAFAGLAWRTLPVRNLSHLKSRLWLLPIYWMLLSAAAWRALWHLMIRPHEWEKTTHRLRLHVR